MKKLLITIAVTEFVLFLTKPESKLALVLALFYAILAFIYRKL